MTQVLKEQVKKNILSSAKKIFSQNGFHKTTMNSIANEANISVGNLYRYFKDKNKLFEALMSVSIGKKLIKNLKDKFIYAAIAHKQGSSDIYENNEELIDFLVSNREELLILFKGSEGTKIEYLTSGLAESLTSLAEKYRKSTINNAGDLSSVHIKTVTQIYLSLIKNIIYIISSYKNRESISEGLQTIFNYHFGGIGRILIKN